MVNSGGTAEAYSFRPYGTAVCFFILSKNKHRSALHKQKNNKECLNKMKKRIMSLLLGLIVIAAIALSGCSAKSETTTAKPDAGKEPYKIGAVFDSSGASSSLGIPERDTVKMMVKKINDNGGINGHPIELVMEDSESDEIKALLKAKKLIQEDKVLAIIGPSTSGTTMSIVPYAQANSIPLISSAASIKIVDPVKDRKWIFKTPQSDTVVAGKIFDYLKTKGLKKVAFMNMNNAYGESGRIEFTKGAEANGITVIAQEKFEATDKDMTAQLTRIKGLNPDAVIVWAIPPSASTVTKNYSQLGIKAPLIHSHGVGNQTFIDLAGPAANGVIFPIGKLLVAEGLPETDPQKQVLTDYINDYKAAYNAAPNAFGGYAYDGLMILVKAIEKAGADSAKIRDELEKMDNFVGVSGIFSMSTTDHCGLNQEDLVLVEVKDGKWQLVK